YSVETCGSSITLCRNVAMAKGGRFSRAGLWLVAAFGIISTIGCGGSKDVDPATASILKGLAGMYAAYALDHQNMGPPDAETLKKYARSMDPRSLGGAGVDKDHLDDYFISPRDKQPMQLRANV